MEATAPANHKISTAEQTKSETGTATTLNYTFTDSTVPMTLKLVKKSARADYGTEATLANAVYGLYARNTVYKTDNKTVVYKANDLVTKLTTDAAGNR